MANSCRTAHADAEAPIVPLLRNLLHRTRSTRSARAVRQGVYRFKPGKSGNPKGAKRKEPSIALDLKLALERALNKTVKLKQGEKERIVTMAVAGIEQLVAQFAKGDRHARRDVIALADKLGV